MQDSRCLARSLAVEIKHLSSLRPLSADDQMLIHKNAERIAEILEDGRAPEARPGGIGAEIKTAFGQMLLALREQFGR